MLGNVDMGSDSPLELLWTEAAAAALETICDYWAVHKSAPAFALKLWHETHERAEFLCTQPFSGKKSRISNIRYVMVGTYALFYQVIASRLVVVAIWDTRRNPASAPFPIELNEP